MRERLCAPPGSSGVPKGVTATNTTPPGHQLMSFLTFAPLILQFPLTTFSPAEGDMICWSACISILSKELV